MASGWHNVSRKEPCPICHKPDWCSVSNDGAVCVCRRVESPHPCKSGMGWVHRLRESEKRKVTNGSRLSSLVSRPTSPAFATLHSTFDGDDYMRDGLALSLGLPYDTFEALDVRYNHANDCMSFPMRDGDGHITGLRYRLLGTSRKWSAKGSKDGLFYDPTLTTNHLVILEGPTDTAAALAIGLPAVGRSACLTGTEPLRQLIRRLRVKRLTIVADRDEPHPLPNGGTWRPGLDGAKRLGAALRHTYRIVLPPPGVKDMRDWYRSGKLTPETFRTAAESAKWCV